MASVPQCKVCGCKLTGEKTKFCSRLCAERFRRWKRGKGARRPYFVGFLSRIDRPIEVSPEQVEAAEKLVAAGKVLAWREEGVVTQIGVPLRPDATPAWLVESRNVRHAKLRVYRKAPNNGKRLARR